MFDPSLPWWEFVLRGVAVYAVLLLLVRLSGKRSVGQFTPFDLLVVVLISEAVSNALTGGDESVLGGLISAATLIGMNGLAGLAASRSARLQAVLEGQPVLIGRDGKLFDAVLRRHRVGRADIAQALREADCSLDRMRCAFLEADGSISILRRAEGAEALD